MLMPPPGSNVEQMIRLGEEIEPAIAAANRFENPRRVSSRGEPPAPFEFAATSAFFSAGVLFLRIRRAAVGITYLLMAALFE